MIELKFPVTQDQIKPAAQAAMTRLTEVEAEVLQLRNLLDLLRRTCKHPSMKQRQPCEVCGYTYSYSDARD